MILFYIQHLRSNSLALFFKNNTIEKVLLFLSTFSLNIFNLKQKRLQHQNFKFEIQKKINEEA